MKNECSLMAGTVKGYSISPRTKVMRNYSTEVDFLDVYSTKDKVYGGGGSLSKEGSSLWDE